MRLGSDTLVIHIAVYGSPLSAGIRVCDQYVL